jgi:hypothetical protein
VSASPPDENPWSNVDVRMERVVSDGDGDGGGGGGGGGRGGGDGDGGGDGGGHGHGHGLGSEIRELGDVPRPPPPPSLARPARLLSPTRERDVVEDKLFVAVVTVDEDGDVVGAHLVRTDPGPRGELASSAIWRFHYDPARDDLGRPIRSTFEQPFQIW